MTMKITDSSGTLSCLINHDRKIGNQQIVNIAGLVQHEFVGDNDQTIRIPRADWHEINIGMSQKLWFCGVSLVALIPRIKEWA